MLRLKNFLAPLMIAALAGFWSCQDGGSELPNELAGNLVGSDRKPAVNAKVGLYSVQYVPGDTANKAPSFTTRTDAQGRYAFRNVPAGKYNVLALQDSAGFFRDSISLSGPEAMGTDTLRALGALAGRVQLQPQHDPRSAVVQVMGTEHYVNVDADGRFLLKGLADGTYRLRAFVALPNYVPAFAEARVRTGMQDTLAAPLVPFYSGIPVVTGIRVSLDTARGLARVSWSPAAYPALLSYLIYRDPAGAVNLSQTPINKLRVTDTVYYDTLYASPLDTAGSRDTAARNWEYRVRVQSTSGTVGEPYRAGTLQAVPPQTVMTGIRLRVLGTHGDSASIKDTIKIEAAFSNPTYTNRRLIWTLGADTLRNRALDARAGADTLVWVAHDTAATPRFTIHALDAAGRIWSRILTVEVVWDRPIADAGKDTTVPYGTLFTLRGKAADLFGRIVKWEWDIGGRGVFQVTRTGDTTFTLPSAESIFLCVLRVTDDDGLIGVDSIRLELIASRIIGTLTKRVDGRETFFWNNRLLFFRSPEFGTGELMAYDIATGSESSLEKSPRFDLGRLKVLRGDSIFVFGAAAEDGKPDSSTAIYHLRRQAWEIGPNLPLAIEIREGVATAAFGKLYLLYGKLYEFDFSLEQWVGMSIPQAINLYPYKMIEHETNLVVISAMAGPWTQFFSEYSPATGQWKKLPDLNRTMASIASVQGRLFAMGGAIHNSNGFFSDINVIEEYDSNMETWVPKSKLLGPRSSANSVNSGSSIFLLGGDHYPNGFREEIFTVEEYRP